MAAGTSSELPIIPKEEAIRFAKECLEAVGAPHNNAQILAQCLIEADYMGHMAQGMNQLESYIQEIQYRSCDPHAVPRILKQSQATAWVDGCNSLGVLVGNYCMELAISKAKSVGIGFVVAKGSNRFGIAGVYSLQALKHDLVGLAFTNSSPIVAPTRTSIAAIGTNPLSLAAPAVNDNFLLDMATSAVDIGKVEMLSRQHLAVPPDWANMKTGALRPLGGNEANSNYKGFGLAMLVEILTGILGGGAYGHHIRKYGDPHQEANLGQCFIAINPEYFASGFHERMSEILGHIRNMQPDSPEKPVLIPGDKERQHMEKVDKEGGIRYVQDQLNSCLRFADELNVKPLLPLKTT